MAKFYIKDSDGESFEVEEIEERDCDYGSDEFVKDDDSIISEEEVIALKKLIPYVDRIIAMIEADNVPEEKTEEPLEDNDLEILQEEKKEMDEDEEVIDTDEMKAKDSKKSFGSIESKKQKVDDTLKNETSVEDAWAKRYGGR